MVLLPGLGCDAALWRHQIAEFSAIAPVQVGDTLSDDDMGAMARRVLAAAPPRFALAGLSMGGYAAFEIMRTAPERVTLLALLDTSARADTPQQTEYRRSVCAAVARTDDYEQLARRSLPQLVSPASPAAVGDEVVAMAVRVGPETYVRQQKAIIDRKDSRSFLGAIAVPTLVIVGADDVLTPIELAREMHDGIGGSALKVVEKSGHLPTLEQPEIVSAHMRAWWLGDEKESHVA